MIIRCILQALLLPTSFPSTSGTLAYIHTYIYPPQSDLWQRGKFWKADPSSPPFLLLCRKPSASSLLLPDIGGNRSVVQDIARLSQTAQCLVAGTLGFFFVLLLYMHPQFSKAVIFLIFSRFPIVRQADLKRSEHAPRRRPRSEVTVLYVCLPGWLGCRPRVPTQECTYVDGSDLFLWPSNWDIRKSANASDASNKTSSHCRWQASIEGRERLRRVR